MVTDAMGGEPTAITSDPSAAGIGAAAGELQSMNLREPARDLSWQRELREERREHYLPKEPRRGALRKGGPPLEP